MKWYALRYCHLLLFILSDCLLPTNALPAKSFGKYRKDTKETTSAKDCEMNLLEEPSKAAEKGEMSLPDEIPKQLDSQLTNTVEEQKTTANQTTKKYLKWLIYPGTKWCGVGNLAANDDDLGPEVETDKCCRTHDKCEDFINGGETKYNLTNKSSFLSLSCDCDNKLHECLRQANTTASNSVGHMFFNFLARPCFGLDYPKRCKKYKGFRNTCSEFVIDTLADKVYQWFPAKKYKKQ